MSFPDRGLLKNPVRQAHRIPQSRRLTTENRVFHSQIQLPPLCVSACPWREPGRITYNETAKLELSVRRKTVQFQGRTTLFNPADSWTEYEGRLRVFSAHLEAASRHLVKLYRFVERTNALDPKEYQATVLALIRELASLVDGVSILVEKGAVEHGWRLARSALEASFFLAYILKDDTERRALAYQVAHFYRRKELSERLDPTTDEGKAFRDDLKGDILEGVFRFSASQLAEIRNHRKELSDPAYSEVQAAWLAAAKGRGKAKRRGLPNWYSLFDGPPSLRALAKKLGLLSLYLQYEQWSGLIHVGSAFDNIASRKGDDKEVSIKPIRHPEHVSSLTSFVGTLHIVAIRSALDFVLPDEALHNTFFSQLKIAEWASLQKQIREGELEIQSTWR